MYLADFRKHCALWATVNIWGWGNDSERNAQSGTKACTRRKQQRQLQAWEVEQAVQGTGTKKVTGLMHGLHGIHGWICPSRAIFKRQHLTQTRICLSLCALAQSLPTVPSPFFSQDHSHIVHPWFQPQHCFLIQLRERQRRKKRTNDDWWLMTQTN